MSTYEMALPFEEVGFRQYRNKPKRISPKDKMTVVDNPAGTGRVKILILPTEAIVEVFMVNPAYTSTDAVQLTEEGAMMKLQDAQQAWMKGGVAILLLAAMIFLVLFLVSERLPKYASGLGVSMGLTGAAIFEWERQVRRRQY